MKPERFVYRQHRMPTKVSGRDIVGRLSDTAVWREESGDGQTKAPNTRTDPSTGGKHLLLLLHTAPITHRSDEF